MVESVQKTPQLSSLPELFSRDKFQISQALEKARPHFIKIQQKLVYTPKLLVSLVCDNFDPRAVCTQLHNSPGITFYDLEENFDLHVISDPIKCQECFKSCCKDCLLGNEFDGEKLCPSCGLDPGQLKIDSDMQEMLEKITFRCDWLCGEEFSHTDREAHFKKCMAQKDGARCMFCTQKFCTQNDLTEHLNQACLKIKMQCKLCSSEINNLGEASSFGNHLCALNQEVAKKILQLEEKLEKQESEIQNFRNFVAGVGYREREKVDTNLAQSIEMHSYEKFY